MLVIELVRLNRLCMHMLLLLLLQLNLDLLPFAGLDLKGVVQQQCLRAHAVIERAPNQDLP